MRHCGRGIKKGEVLKVVIDKEKIEFSVGNVVLGTQELDELFQHEEVLPYVTLFSDGDKL